MINRLLSFIKKVKKLFLMNQTKRVEPSKSRAENVIRRPKRCMVCRKMIAFEKFNQHTESCTRAEQIKIEENRIRQRNIRNSTNNKPIQMSIRKKQVEEKMTRVGTNEGTRFRIKSLNNGMNPSQYKSRSVFVNNNKKAQIKIEQKLPDIQEIKIEKKEQIESNTENILQQNESTVSLQINQPPFFENPENNERIVPDHSNYHFSSQVDRNQIAPISNLTIQRQRTSQIRYTFMGRNQSNQLQQPNPPTLIQENRQQIPQRQQERGYNIQALINNSNSIIQFIRSINILTEDETMNTMLSQLQQLNLIAQQIVQLSALGQNFGSTMGNLFASRIHQLQTVITNQIGIALIRGFNERLGAEFQGLIQRRPEIKEGFTQAQIQQYFPQKVNFNRKECSICLDDMKPCDLIIELQCYHLFHPGCIKQWLVSSKKCPMCRKVQQEIK